ncbi:hypothetical protein [Salisediminibacterium selenitireducens]|uniref:Uncharacterized protein n=1 Tax=Bacillus selenitireducens (strain ATCC 700615 / DSM 15326 / MLS10) TaxID=439292 RepID=D6XZ77_BACIE|nr:hypothetical protein [Salisediminibacterium selenitireducens]ADI00362.1 hypothetical protein Bsel_2873 [[Bacillus] selenitireducens MLS10]
MKKLQAYFKTENDAENAATSLKAFATESVLVDRIPEAGSGLLFFPVNALNISGINVQPAPNEEGTSLKERLEGETAGETVPDLNYVIECHVAEEDLNKALDALADANAYLDEAMSL